MYFLHLTSTSMLDPANDLIRRIAQKCRGRTKDEFTTFVLHRQWPTAFR